MKRTPILICVDAGEAGRPLLSRRDIDLRWALTVDEAIAAAQRERFEVILTREAPAPELLERMEQNGLSCPCLVLIEPSGWNHRESYFGLGATALMRASNSERILEAISELTGLSFRQAPRVPYEEVVEVELKGNSHYSETSNISHSGVTIRGLPNAQIGDIADIQFVMLDSPERVRAMVIRKSGNEIGLCFQGLSEHQRVQLDMLLSAERAKAEPEPPPIGLTVDLLTSTADLVSTDRDEIDALRAQLAAHLLNQAEAPTWLVHIGQQMTDIERDGLCGVDVPQWAHAALMLRLELGQGHADGESPSVQQCHTVLDFSRALAVESVQARAVVLSQVTQIRAALLRMLYGGLESSARQSHQLQPSEHGPVVGAPELEHPSA